MEPVTMALIAGSLAAGGAGANYMGGQSEARRKSRAIKRARAQMEALDAQDQASTDRQIGSQSEAGNVRQTALLDHLMRMGAGSMPEAQQQVDATNAEAARLAGPAMTDGTDTGQAAASLQVARQHPQQQARNALALLQGLGQAESRSGARGKTQALTADVPLMRALLQEQMLRQELERQRSQVQADLGSTLSTTGNTAANLQLLGGLMNAGAQGGFMYAGHMPASPTPTPNSGWV